MEKIISGIVRYRPDADSADIFDLEETLGEFFGHAVAQTEDEDDSAAILSVEDIDPQDIADILMENKSVIGSAHIMVHEVFQTPLTTITMLEGKAAEIIEAGDMYKGIIMAVSACMPLALAGDLEEIILLKLTATDTENVWVGQGNLFQAPDLTHIQDFFDEHYDVIAYISVDIYDAASGREKCSLHLTGSVR